MKFFPSHLNNFENCPRKYFYSRDPEIRAKYAKASPHLVLGNAVHDALQMFFDISKVPVGERTYDRLKDLLRDAWAGREMFRRNHLKQQKAREEAFGGDRAQEKSWGQKGLNILYRFHSTADLEAVPLTTEQFHELRLTDHVTLGGKIDRIDRLENGDLVVMDYKTGKPPWDTSDAAMAEEDIQLAAYALVVTGKFRGKVARCSYLYLDHEVEAGYEPTADLLESKKNDILGICERILSEKDFEPTPNPLCPWCDYKELCPRGDEWERGRGGAEQANLPF